jgi:hypothetical protein
VASQAVRYRAGATTWTYRAAGGELEQIQLLLGHAWFKRPSGIWARNRI